MGYILDIFQVLSGAVACKGLVLVWISVRTTLSAFRRRYALPLSTISAEWYRFNFSTHIIQKVPVSLVFLIWRSLWKLTYGSELQGLWFGIICGLVVQMLLLLAITMCTNWDKEVGKSTENFSHNRALFRRLLGVSSSYNVWLIILHFSCVGSQGKGRSFQFVPASRHDDMSMGQRCRIALAQDQDASWAKEIWNSSRIWLPFRFHVTGMALPGRKRHPTSDLFWWSL